MENVGYTADEVLEIAEDIEKEGEAFYRRAAEVTGDTTMKELFLGLAQAEKEHRETFQNLRAQLAAGSDSATIENPDETVSLYLRAVAKGTVFPSSDKPVEDLPSTETKILDMAINAELETILYYCGMKDLVVDQAAADAVNKVMEEEKKHVVTLTRYRGLFEESAV